MRTAFAEMRRLVEVSLEKSSSHSGERSRTLGYDDVGEEVGGLGRHFSRVVGMIHAYLQHD